MSYTEKLIKLRDELNIRYTQVSKLLSEMAKRLNEIIPPVDDMTYILKKEYYNEYGRKIRYTWAIKNGRLKIAEIRSDGSVNFRSVESVMYELSSGRKYGVLKFLATTLPMFLDDVLRKAEEDNKELDNALVKLKVMLQILK